jgi:predicted Zn finger-like uncharacterized protein
MTMLTRCAACNTAFRITTEQLVSRQGRVRCGHCGEVFSALDRLVPHPDESASAVATADAHVAQGAADAPAGAKAPEPVSYDLFGAPPPAGTHETPAPPPVLSPLLAPPAPRRFAWWSFGGAVLATLVLAAQGAWFYRNQLAVLVPQAKPHLEAACAELGCRIEPPVDPQSISIESSDLQAEPGGRSVLILSAVLRNRASFAQELPLLELSLTDAQDAALARRVLRPADYAPGTRPPTVASGGEHQVRLYIDAGQLKANGYRLYAFYP